MQGKFSVTTELTSDAQLLKFRGQLDEDSDFHDVILADRDLYYLDMEEVHMINSCGIREWINFLSRFEKGKILIYKRCPQLVVEQMNMVGDFLRDGARVESFYAPYFCEACELEKQLLLDVEQINQESPPKVDCDGCGKEMIFDIVEELYFRFLKAG